MTSPIQIPYLRPDPIHEGAGLQQAGGEDQLSQLAKLLMLKGHLSLEQEKFQAEEGARKEKKQTLAQLSQGLSQIFQQPGVMDDPSKLAGAFGQASSQFAGAGMGPEAASAAGQIPKLQEQAKLSATQKALGLVMEQYKNAKDPLDPGLQAQVYGQLFQIDPDVGRSFAEGLKALGGRFTFYTDLLGQ